MIEGVVIHPLRQIPDERGRVMHMLRASDPHFQGLELSTALIEEATEPERVTRVELLIVSKDPDGNLVERPLHQPQAIPRPYDPNGRDPAQDVIFLNENI